jgi:hypothetical protein
MNIQLDLILWMYPIAEAVSLLSNESGSYGPGNDMDLPWE